MMKAIVDRIEENTAVLELEDRNILSINVSRISEAKEGDVIYLKLDESGEICEFFIDKKETEEKKNAADARLKRLFKK